MSRLKDAVFETIQYHVLKWKKYETKEGTKISRDDSVFMATAKPSAVKVFENTVDSLIQETVLESNYHILQCGVFFASAYPGEQYLTEIMSFTINFPTELKEAILNGKPEEKEEQIVSKTGNVLEDAGQGLSERQGKIVNYPSKH